VDPGIKDPEFYYVADISYPQNISAVEKARASY